MQNIKSSCATASATPDVTSEVTSDSKSKHSGLLANFDHFANHVTSWVGTPIAFGSALGGVIIWALVGPVFKYSENWQLIINTGTSVVTFLMVFLIQQSQSKDSVALHLKLDELLKATKSANNQMMCIEDLDEEELRSMAAHYLKLAKNAQHSANSKAVPSQ
ncbi:hypothetical protein DJFAAGMI_01297 [Comamonas sp. PE63]|uniref:Low affinity iron permease family protein n=1 Tax=Comamonas brasiliensis TaxID=1812482 RepID=A0ABS5LPY4_9BURK|nr:low affinity iron permease family protein [Comamonas sp. PE63]MBS3018565.1 hypothetical protein [Comamonas sp. PE63]